MKSWPTRSLLLAGAALLVAIPALGQNQEAPESLLPPGFGDPQSLPPPEAAPAPPSTSEPPEAGSAPRISETPQVRETARLDEEELEPPEQPRPTNYFAIPEGTARPVDLVGPLRPGNGGLGADAFGRTNGAFLSSLMASLDAPLPSRWTSILLRRALLSRLAAPAAIHPVDWVAARADLLVRMGEADAARMLVQSVDQPAFTPRMIEAAADTALATGDMAGLCPLAGPANSRQTVWQLVEGMCAALEGEPARASALVDEARRRGDIGGVDLLLAQKVVGAGAASRRAATIDWEEVSGLTPWRFGLAAATGAELPERLVSSAPPAMQAWFARAPMIPLEQRLGAAWTAAALGVFSSSALVEIHSLMLDRTDPAEAAETVGARLRTAWTARDPGARVDALQALWGNGSNPRERYGRMIMTASAAAAIAPAEAHEDEAADLIASMLAGGRDRRAARWAGLVQDSGDDRAWALLATGAPEGAVDTGAGRVETYMDNDQSRGRRASQLLVAALAGLGRLPEQQASNLAGAAGASLGRNDRWSNAIDAAARRREPGTVILLAAAGMQTGDWWGVPPAYLYRIVRALRAVGLDFEARMIAAEAVARL